MPSPFPSPPAYRQAGAGEGGGEGSHEGLDSNRSWKDLRGFFILMPPF
jgi:hypothetical protein